jgi:hypothetical protein
VRLTQTIVEEQLVKSRHRVVDKTFLEPAAGHGNFLDMSQG